MSSSPVEEIAAELERLAVEEFDVRAFLLGYLIGREWAHGLDTHLYLVRVLYGRERALHA